MLYIYTTYEFTENFGCYIFLYIRVENYEADMKLNVLDGSICFWAIKHAKQLDGYAQVVSRCVCNIWVSLYRLGSLD